MRLRRRSRAVGFAFFVLVGVLTGCSADAGPVTTPLTTSAPITTTTTPPTTTTWPAPTSTTTPEPEPVIRLDGSHVVYSATGDVMVQGDVTRRTATVTGSLDGAPLEVQTGSGYFWVGLALDVGTHEVVIGAVDDSGFETVLGVTVIVDPDLEVRFAYLECIDVSEGRLIATYAEWFTGDEALAAARDDGFIDADDELENNYYIRLPSAALHTLDLSDAPVVILQACYEPAPCVTRRPVAAETWGLLATNPEGGLGITGWHWYGLGTLPYWLTLRDGIVVQAEEWYLP
jgi:hypothetical protein